MKIALTFLAITLSIAVIAQVSVVPELVSSGGGYAELTDIRVSYSIGEPIIGISTDGNTTLTQGFQQSDFSITSIDKLTLLGFNLFPNPTDGILIVEYGEAKFQDIRLRISDINGRLILQERLDEFNRSELDISVLTAGTYILTILSEQKNLGTSKIIKL